jgi:hypothetical protein
MGSLGMGGGLSTVPPPPSGAPSTPAPPPPSASPSPAPPEADDKVARGIKLVIQGVQSFRQLGDLIPGAVPIVTKINDLAQELQKKVMAAGKPAEPAAPPVPPA